MKKAVEKPKDKPKKNFIVAVFDDRMPEGFAKFNVRASITVMGLKHEVEMVLVIQHALKQVYAKLSEQEQHCIGVKVYKAERDFRVLDGGMPEVDVDFKAKLDNALLVNLREHLLDAFKAVQHV
jgi:hypothetical protein